MPTFKSTKDIIKTPWEDEVFDENWMDSPILIVPETKKWDYKREMQIEDVDIWEVISEGYNNSGVYVSWKPYAEFYMIVTSDFFSNKKQIETFYGPGSINELKKRLIELKIPYNENKIWVEDDEMFLYKTNKSIIKKYSF